ncbi:hypothetical protein [Nostoc sp. NZL]|uniref:hypothetical protein n=1 Tax=Nostoc sp. NZL TaxID=2650612 RepID=UPI0018C74EB6|nr:hypothetical protein [Nostoc sp. NZL]MBG1239711.1 hypothetical protein [Nostoc sp. NZL]
MMSSQVIAIAGTQRGGKGTLAAILATLSTALDPGLNTQYLLIFVTVPVKFRSSSGILTFPSTAEK